ncbi:hypothetical protein F4678DRAFT_334511 [Xylaria arbuscula]|nr:hypothetical protein F4678DRAFT_334511 [Xylaria arbuscula]
MAPRDLRTEVPQRPLELLDNSHSLSKSFENADTRKKRSKHDGLYSQILEERQADGLEPTSDDEFYSSEDVERVAVNGFPSIAAFQASYPNTRLCRAFDYLNQRLIMDYQCQLTCLLGALVDLDAESATKIETAGGQHCQPVPFDKEGFILRCLQSPNQISLVQVPKTDQRCEEDEQQKKDRIESMRWNLFANIELILNKYCIAAPMPFPPCIICLINSLLGSRVCWQNELRKFPRASAKTHGKLFKKLKDMSGLDPDALDYLRADDDFIYADPDPLYERFCSILIDIRVAVVKSTRFLTCGRLFVDGGAQFGSGVWNAHRVRLFIKSLMVISSSTLVLVPVGILYLNEPRREIAFLVVTLFALAFAFTLIVFDNQMSHVLLGLAAYSAVLVVFLSVPLLN